MRLLNRSCLAFLALQVCSACALASYGEGMPRISPAADVVAIGDAAAACIEKTLVPLRPQLGQAKRDLVRGGAIATTGALIGAAIHSRVDEGAQADVALGSSIFAALIGGYQIWRGVGQDPADYVSAAGALIGKYMAAKTAADSDVAKKRQAVVDLLNGAAGLQEKHGEYATFVLTSSECS
jgi:hypothetical protein